MVDTVAQAARIATLSLFSGKVEVQRSQKDSWEPVKIKMPLYVKDKVRTAAKSSAEIVLDDNSILRLKERSVMEIRDISEERGARNTSFGVLIGKVWTSVTPQPAGSKFQILSTSATVGVRGTVMAVSVDVEQNMRVLLFEGSAMITTIRARMEEAQSLMLSANQAVNITPVVLSQPEPIKRQERGEWDDFIKEMDKIKDAAAPEAGIKPGGTIKYSIKAKNVEGKEKESAKYSIETKGGTRQETQ